MANFFLCKNIKLPNFPLATMDSHQFIHSVTLYMVYTIILSLLYSVHMCEGAPASARLEYFPGFSGKLRSEIYTGYVTVDEAHERELFYYFVKSERNPENDPILLWLTGGPGCSSFSGFMYENGPFYFDLNDTSESLPKVHENPDSWSKVSSMLFLDSPVGTGFSYSNTTEDYVTGDFKTVSDIYAFLIKWLEEYPEFLHNPLYIAGDSYAGIFVPMAAQKIVNGNEAGMKHINLKGYMVGNGATDPMFDGNSKVPFAHGMGLISDELYQAVKEACNGSYWNPTDDACLSKMLAVWQNLFGLYPNHILDPLCFWSVEKKQTQIKSSDENINRSSKQSAFSEYLLETWRISSLLWLKSSKCLDGQLQLGQQDDPCAVDPYKISVTWANNPSVRKEIHAKTIFGSIFAVAGGLDVGKEGPMVHTGACIASLLGQGGSKRYHLTWRWLRYFKNDRDRRDLITCGAAAGVAAAFRAPVGGVLFALEEAASWWRSALLWRTFFTTAVVAVVLRAFMNYCNIGKCGLFGKGGLIMFDVSSVNITYHITDLLPVIVLGVIGGVFGGLYNYLLDKVLRVYNLINERGPMFKLLLASTVSIFTSCCYFGLPWIAKCIPCPEGLDETCPTIGRSGNFKKFQCPPGHYNDLASLFFNTSDDAIRNLFSSGTKSEFHVSSILLFFCAVYVLAIFSYGIAVPSGLFIPVILTGASYGRFVGMLFGSFTDLDQGLFAVLGAASFLGGSMRMTVSLCVILLELTNNLLMLPLVMLVLLISKTVADAFNSGVYDQIVHLKGLPFLEPHAEPYMRNLTAVDVVRGPLVTFSGIEKVDNIMQVLKSCKHNGFPVIDEPPFSETPILYGLVLRSHLLVLLKKKIFLPSRDIASADFVERFSSVDFAKPGSGKGLNIEEIEISADEAEMFIDLHPFANTSPYTVVETMSLAKAQILFRQVGLRHLCVVPKSSGRPPIVGILTRHDFMPEFILEMYPELKHNRWKRLRIRLSVFTGIMKTLPIVKRCF